ncbi:TACR2 family protein [Megaselia abdita]
MLEPMDSGGFRSFNTSTIPIVSSTPVNHNLSHIEDNTFYFEHEDYSGGDISYTLPIWRQILWSVLFGGIVVVSTGGNLIVIWIVMTNKAMRTVTNYFIVNLSIADAMVSSLNVTFSFVYMLHNHWPFGTAYCKISQAVSIISISASVLTLMAISFDRYMAIINPLRPRMGKRCTLTIAAGIWLFSIFLSIPMLSVFTTASLYPAIDHVPVERTVCYGKWPDGDTNNSYMENVYNWVFMLLIYFVPIGSMCFTYARIGLELWRSDSIGESCTWRQMENIKSKRRIVKMMMVVVSIFAVCWLPFHIYFILTFYYPQITEEDYIQELYLAIYWLAMSNSMYNPIIYYYMNSRFRRGFRMFFQWIPCVNKEPESLQRNPTSRYSCSGSPDHHRIKRIDTEKSNLYSTNVSPNSRRRKSTGANSLRMSKYSTGRNSTTASYILQQGLMKTTPVDIKREPAESQIIYSPSEDSDGMIPLRINSSFLQRQNQQQEQYEQQQSVQSKWTSRKRSPIS